VCVSAEHKLLLLLLCMYAPVVPADGMEVDGDEGDVQPSGRAGPSQAAAKPPNGRGRGG
jgi:hypothetical protein